MLSFVPDFNLEPLDDCKQAALQSAEFDADMDAAVRTIAGSARAMGLNVEGVE